jgi:hypothetical protein
MTDTQLGLVRINKARRALAEARTVDEIKQIRNQGIAIAQYLKAQEAGYAMVNDAKEIAVRAERRIGEILAKMEKRSAGRPPENRSPERTDLPPTLGDLGISKNQSADWQQLAALPEQDFERYIQETKEQGKLITTGRAVEIARRAVRLERQVMDAVQRGEQRAAAFTRPVPAPPASDPCRVAWERERDQLDGAADGAIFRAGWTAACAHFGFPEDSGT